MTSFHDLLIDYRSSLTEFVAPVAAEKLVASLDTEQQQLLDEWLAENTNRFVAEALALVDRRERAVIRARAGARAFAAADDSGDVSPFATFLVVDDGGLRRRVAEMTGHDHNFVAAQYVTRGNANLMCAAFHHAVANQIGPKSTAEVMTEAKYLELMQSITGSRATAA